MLRGRCTSTHPVVAITSSGARLRLTAGHEHGATSVARSPSCSPLPRHIPRSPRRRPTRCGPCRASPSTGTGETCASAYGTMHSIQLRWSWTFDAYACECAPIRVRGGHASDSQRVAYCLSQRRIRHETARSCPDHYSCRQWQWRGTANRTRRIPASPSPASPQLTAWPWGAHRSYLGLRGGRGTAIACDCVWTRTMC